MRFQRRTLSSTACSSSDSTRFGVIHELSYPQSLVSLHALHYIPSVSSHHTCTRGAIRSSSHSYESSSSSDSPTDLPSSVRTYRALIGRPRCLNRSKDVYPRLVLCSAKTPFECFTYLPTFAELAPRSDSPRFIRSLDDSRSGTHRCGELHEILHQTGPIAVRSRVTRFFAPHSLTQITANSWSDFWNLRLPAYQEILSQ